MNQSAHCTHSIRQKAATATATTAAVKTVRSLQTHKPRKSGNERERLTEVQSLKKEKSEHGCAENAINISKEWLNKWQIV